MSKDNSVDRDAIDDLVPSRRTPRRMVLVLPVAPGGDCRWGDGLTEIARLDLHEVHSAACAAPCFDRMPWYADHPSDPSIRQETQVLQALPRIDALARGVQLPRYLLGFSKSGWGAMSLLLRHPDLFAGAVAFDAPLMAQVPNQWGMLEVFATQENFDRYCVSRLMQEHAASLRDRPRIGLIGHASFSGHMEQARELLDRLNVPHLWYSQSGLTHQWDGGWLAEAFEMIDRLSDL